MNIERKSIHFNRFTFGTSIYRYITHEVLRAMPQNEFGPSRWPFDRSVCFCGSRFSSFLSFHSEQKFPFVEETPMENEEKQRISDWSWTFYYETLGLVATSSVTTQTWDYVQYSRSENFVLFRFVSFGPGLARTIVMKWIEYCMRYSHQTIDDSGQKWLTDNNHNRLEERKKNVSFQVDNIYECEFGRADESYTHTHRRVDGVSSTQQKLIHIMVAGNVSSGRGGISTSHTYPQSAPTLSSYRGKFSSAIAANSILLFAWSTAYCHHKCPTHCWISNSYRWFFTFFRRTISRANFRLTNTFDRNTFLFRLFHKSQYRKITTKRLKHLSALHLVEYRFGDFRVHDARRSNFRC